MNDQRNGGIAWTDFTANPIKFKDSAGKIVWACAKVSAGCTNCYAETLAHRYGKGGPFNAGEVAKLTPFADDKEINTLIKSTKISGKRVFIGDMTDIFGEWVSDEQLDKVFAAMALRPDVTFQVLTKRAERMRAYMSAGLRLFEVEERFNEMYTDDTISSIYEWPLPHVWLGVSSEDQDAANDRIPKLLQTPAAVRFVSYEPALGPIDFHRLENPDDHFHASALQGQHDDNRYEFDNQLDWIIVGGESGGGARPFDVAWAHSAVEQCKAAGVAVFVKQLGANPITHVQTVPDRSKWHGTKKIMGALGLLSRKGSDMTEWPEALRVQEFPQSGAQETI